MHCQKTAILAPPTTLAHVESITIKPALLNGHAAVEIAASAKSDDGCVVETRSVTLLLAADAPEIGPLIDRMLKAWRSQGYETIEPPLK